MRVLGGGAVVTSRAPTLSPTLSPTLPGLGLSTRFAWEECVEVAAARAEPGCVFTLPASLDLAAWALTVWRVPGACVAVQTGSDHGGDVQSTDYIYIHGKSVLCSCRVGSFHLVDARRSTHSVQR